MYTNVKINEALSKLGLSSEDIAKIGLQIDELTIMDIANENLNQLIDFTDLIINRYNSNWDRLFEVLGRK